MGQLWRWWYEVVIRMLQGDVRSVSAVAVAVFIDDLRDKFTRDNLPTLIHLSDISDQEVEAKYGGLPFVHQMRWVDAPSIILQKAIVDYYRAYKQQACWLEDDLIGWHELEEFENKLRDEWEREFSWATANVGDVDEATKKKIGRNLLRLALDQTRHRVRERYDEPFFSRGKYHELANRRKIENGIGWHPDFERKMEELLITRVA
jgi:hypothetical protein